jgi:hypothetical protein
MAYTLIQTLTVGAGGNASFDFTSIPQGFTDLLVLISCRTNNNSDGALVLSFNGATTNRSTKALYGNGSTASSYSGSSPLGALTTNPLQTASTFANSMLYIPNYASTTTNKSSSMDGVTENNATGASQFINANLWASSSAITQITLTPEGGGSLVQYSTASLYGIK